ncbi:MAG: hypothetical protein GWO84_01955 [Euryarchaeota archaeon]|nr:hypothetical protein [Euryarchaeota archaeon]
MDDDSNSTVDLEQMTAHKKAWDQHALLGNILSREYYLIEQIGGRWPSWIIDVKQDGDVHDSLKKINSHIAKLGWMARLSNDDPWLVTILPMPDRQFPTIKVHLFLWSMTALTATLAGSLWIENTLPEGGWFGYGLFLDSFIGFTLPILATLFLASVIQVKADARQGLRLGHIAPIPDISIAFWSVGLFSPSTLIWPFGLLLISSLPRMSSRPWDNRSQLGTISIIAPAVMICSGFVLWAIGIFLTPELVNIVSAPRSIEPPLIVELLAVLFYDDIPIRLAWAHPLAKAGSVLTFFGWISLLPIPTFPGGRLMVSRLGSVMARNSGTQVRLFFVILIFAWLFKAFDGFSVWTLVLALILPFLYYMGGEPRVPIVLDEPAGLDLKTEKRLGIFFFLFFMLALPSQSPVLLHDDWQSPLVFEFDEIEAASRGDDGVWMTNLTIKIINPSFVQHSYAIDVVREGGQSIGEWDYEWNCKGEDSLNINGLGCGEDLLPGKFATFDLIISWNQSLYSPLGENFSLLMSTEEGYQLQYLQVSPALEVYPSSDWNIVEDNGEVKRCVKLNGDIGPEESLLVSFPNANTAFTTETRLYWIEGQTDMDANLSEIPDEVCVIGLDPIILRAWDLNHISLNGIIFAATMPAKPLKAIVPQDGWKILGDGIQGYGAEFATGGLLKQGEQCPIDSHISTPPSPVDGDWIWDMSVRNEGQIPALVNETNLTLIMEEGLNVSLCQNQLNPNPQTTFAVEQGPELILVHSNISYRLWSNIWAAATNGSLISSDSMSTFSFYNPSNSSIPVMVANEGSGSSWQVINSSTSLDQGMTEFSFMPSNSTFSTMWISHQDGGVVIHLGSYI